jgi:uncharacterized small protein (DUF1192 family)
MSVTVVTQEDVNRFNAPAQAVAKRIADKNIGRKRRASGTIKHELEARQSLNRNTVRQLEEAKAQRVELINSVDQITARVAALRAEGAHRGALEKYVGYDFTDKAERKVHHPGTLDVCKEELARLDKRIANLQKGVENLKSTLPLEEELAESLRLEKLGM